MKHSTVISAIGAAAVALFTPSMASAQSGWSVTIGSGFGYGYPGYDSWRSTHRDLHDDLDDEHDDDHDQLDEEHAEAHEQWMTPREHRRLHRHLDREHARDHNELNWEHWRKHQQNYYNRDRPYYGGYGW